MDSTSLSWHAEQSESGLQAILPVVCITGVVVVFVIVVIVGVEVDVILGEVAVISDAGDDDVVFGLKHNKTRVIDKNNIINREQYNKNLLLIIFPICPMLP